MLSQRSFDLALPIGGSRSVRNHHIRLDLCHEPTVTFVSVDGLGESAAQVKRMESHQWLEKVKRVITN